MKSFASGKRYDLLTFASSPSLWSWSTFHENIIKYNLRSISPHSSNVFNAHGIREANGPHGRVTFSKDLAYFSRVLLWVLYRRKFLPNRRSERRDFGARGGRREKRRAARRWRTDYYDAPAITFPRRHPLPWLFQASLWSSAYRRRRRPRPDQHQHPSHFSSVSLSAILPLSFRRDRTENPRIFPGRARKKNPRWRSASKSRTGEKTSIRSAYSLFVNER